MRSPFSCFPFFFLVPLTINHRSEGRRKEITAMFLVLVPAGLGGCYFRLNQLHAGSLDEMPPHGNLLEVSPGGGFHQCDLGPEKLQPLRSPQAPQLKPGWEPNFFQGTPLGKMAPLPDSAGKNASSVLRKQLHPRCEDQTLPRVSGFTSLTAEFKKSVKSGLSSLWPKEGERNAARTHVGLEMRQRGRPSRRRSGITQPLAHREARALASPAGDRTLARSSEPSSSYVS